MKLPPVSLALRALAFAGLAAALPAAHALNVTLDFSGNICGAAGNLACSNYNEIGANYGDQAGALDVSYRSGRTSDGSTYEPFMKFWDNGYSGLQNVAWGGADSASYFSEITFTPLAGQQVTLNSFDFGDYLDRNRGSSVAVYDLSNVLLWNGGAFDPGLTPTGFSPAISSSSGLVLRFGPDGYDVGIDNINLTVSAAALVPEPETYALMLAGLVALGAAARRRQR